MHINSEFLPELKNKILDIKHRLSTDVSGKLNPFSFYGCEFTGTDFNVLFRDTKFMKYVGDNYNNFKYYEGRNTDTQIFKPYGSCNGGGLYLTTDKFIHEYSGNYGPTLVYVTIPNEDGVRVFVEESNRIKANIVNIEAVKGHFVETFVGKPGLK